MSAISFKNVSKSFRKIDAVNGLSMEIPAGKVTAFLGPNGAGKTTTIKLLLGLHEQSEGSITVFGVDSQKLSPKDFQSIAYVSENQKLPLWMTVAQFLDFCRPLYPTWDRELEASILAQFELNPKAKLKSLSRGQLMKASLLSNLAYRPKLVVLDEPFSGLDPLVRDEFIRGLLEFTEQEGWTVFVSSHDIEEVERLADNVALIDHGKLQLNESTDLLLERFRQLQIPIAEGATIPATLPKSWMNPVISGRFLHVTESAWEGSLDPLVLTDFATGPASAQPLSLREIFVALAKSYRLNS